MTHALTTPNRDAVDPDVLHRFSVADVRAMVEAGVIDAAAPLELECGLFVAMPPPNDAHAQTVRKLIGLLFRTLPLGDSDLLIQDAVILNEDTYYEPDAAVLKPGTYGQAHARDVLLAIEVSDSTLRRDRGRKAGVYAAASVPELWVVALPERALYAYREAHADGYRSVRKLTPGEALAPLAFPGAPLDVADMLPDAPRSSEG